MAPTTREPGGSPLVERLRELRLTGHRISPWAEAALLAAARAELVEDVIGPALEGGAVVISDRYLDSSLAYQGVARGLGVERVLQLNLPAIGERLPDRTFLLEIDPDESARRVGQNGDRIEREDGKFRRQVAFSGLLGAPAADRLHALVAALDQQASLQPIGALLAGAGATE